MAFRRDKKGGEKVSNTETIALVIGIVMPLLVTVVKQAGLNKWLNLLICVVACGIAGFVTVWARGELQWGNALAAIATVFVAAQAVYGAFWRWMDIEGIINDKTSLIKREEG